MSPKHYQGHCFITKVKVMHYFKYGTKPSIFLKYILPWNLFIIQDYLGNKPLFGMLRVH